MKKEIDVLKIKAIMQHYGLNQTDFSAKTGIPKTSVSKILRGERTCGEGIANKILLAFDNINAAWLFESTGQMMSRDNSCQTFSGDITITGNGNSHIGHGQQNVVNSNDGEDASYIEVEEVERAPILSATLARAPQVDVLEAVSEKVGELEKAPVGVFNAPVSIWYRVQDESLAPKYEVGDLLALWAYPKGEEDPIPGRMYGINTTTNGLIVRRLFPQEDGGYIARAANRDEFPDYRIKPGNVVQIYKIMLMVRF